MTQTTYTLHRITPSSIQQVASGPVYADICLLAGMATKGEEPNCRWQVRKSGSDDALYTA